MYCVFCDRRLNDTNQEGILCHVCKQAQRKKRIVKVVITQVRYCYCCGKPYRPTDASIRHECCEVTERQIGPLRPEIGNLSAFSLSR